jgi:hypothetical protein
MVSIVKLADAALLSEGSGTRSGALFYGVSQEQLVASYV